MPTLVATVGGASSNTYATLAEADAYHDSRGSNSEWTGATDGSKNTHLVWAGRLLDQQCWCGDRSTEEQAMRWPRYGTYDRDGWPIDSDIVPQWLKDAQSELAFQLMKSDRQNDPVNQVKKVKADVIEVEFVDGVRLKVWPESVMAIIRPYIEQGPRVVAV